MQIPIVSTYLLTWGRLIKTVLCRPGGQPPHYISADPIWRRACETNNHHQQPITITNLSTRINHHLVQSPDTGLLGQSSNQPTNITNDQTLSRTTGHLPLNQAINQPTNQTTKSQDTPTPPGSQPLILSLQLSPRPSISSPQPISPWPRASSPLVAC